MIVRLRREGERWHDAVLLMRGRRVPVGVAVGLVGLRGAARADIDPLSGVDFVTITHAGNAPWPGNGTLDDRAVGRGGVGRTSRLLCARLVRDRRGPPSRCRCRGEARRVGDAGCLHTQKMTNRPGRRQNPGGSMVTACRIGRSRSRSPLGSGSPQEGREIQSARAEVVGTWAFSSEMLVSMRQLERVVCRSAKKNLKL